MIIVNLSKYRSNYQCESNPAYNVHGHPLNCRANPILETNVIFLVEMRVIRTSHATVFYKIEHI